MGKTYPSILSSSIHCGRILKAHDDLVSSLLSVEALSSIKSSTEYGAIESFAKLPVRSGCHTWARPRGQALRDRCGWFAAVRYGQVHYLHYLNVHLDDICLLLCNVFSHSTDFSDSSSNAFFHASGEQSELLYCQGTQRSYASSSPTPWHTGLPNRPWMKASPRCCEDSVKATRADG